jgi:hypothetical protein
LIEACRTIAESENVLYLDPTAEVKVDQQEGVHIDSENHKKLAELIYEKINNIY